MTRPDPLKLVIATTLTAGETVYLTADDIWTRYPHEAEVIDDEAHGQLRLLHAIAQKQTVTGAYLGDARFGAAGAEPLHNPKTLHTHTATGYLRAKQARAAVPTGVV